MENEREYLLKSVKTEQTASYDLGMIVCGIMLACFAWFGFGMVNNSFHFSSDEEKMIVILYLAGIISFGYGFYTSSMFKKWIPQTEIVFFAHHLECKACPYSAVLGGVTNIAANLNLKYDQIEEVTVARKRMIFSVSGKRYILAAENIEECEAMLTEMKRRNANQ